MTEAWKAGDTVVWRGIYRNRVWHATPTVVVRDTMDELVLSLTPGTDCMVEENCAREKRMANAAGISNTRIGDWNT